MERMICDLRMTKVDGDRFIEWRTCSDFEYRAEIGNAVQVVSKHGGFYRGVISDLDESGLYLRTSIRLGSPQVHVLYEDVIDIELKTAAIPPILDSNVLCFR